MAGLAESGSNADVDLLYDINGLAGDAPRWFDRAMAFVGESGLPITMVLLVIGCWWSVRRRGGEDAATSVAALVWAPLAAALAVVVNVPIRDFVARPRPFVEHEGLDVLIGGKGGYSFVSDHAALAMALGVGLFVANRRFGLVGIALGLFEGFCRVYMGVHYPTDVVGGLALGTAVALLLAPVAMAVLTPVVKAVARSAHGAWLVGSAGDERERTVVPSARDTASEEKDLAA
jgi:undecaprenyl-diphosphatase